MVQVKLTSCYVLDPGVLLPPCQGSMIRPFLGVSHRDANVLHARVVKAGGVDGADAEA